MSWASAGVPRASAAGDRLRGRPNSLALGVAGPEPVLAAPVPAIGWSQGPQGGAAPRVSRTLARVGCCPLCSGCWGCLSPWGSWLRWDAGLVPARGAELAAVPGRRATCSSLAPAGSSAQNRSSRLPMKVVERHGGLAAPGCVATAPRPVPPREPGEAGEIGIGLQPWASSRGCGCLGPSLPPCAPQQLV